MTEEICTSDYKKQFDVKGANPDQEEDLEKLPSTVRNNFRGISGDPLPEPLPKYIKTKSEKVVSGANNTYIVLGRDRPAGRGSGYINNTQAGAIDIVVGRGAPCPKKYQPEPKKKDTRKQLRNKQMWLDPNFAFDAARIYISQKTDVDKNFDLADGKVGVATAKSAVALKADGIRIIAREGIKLVTHVDGYNSQGGEVASVNGIDLIANNDDEILQPLVKGENLIEALKKLVTHVDKLTGIVDAVMTYQSHLNRKLTHHTHLAPQKVITVPGGVIWETCPSFPVAAQGIKTSIDQLTSSKISMINIKNNLGIFTQKYFNPACDGYINSRHNNTT
jgi:hypothetical protein